MESEQSSYGISSSPKSLVIAVAGSLSQDIIFNTGRIPRPGESVIATSLVTAPGGKGANIAIAAYRAGHQKPHKQRDIIQDSTDVADVQIFMNGAVGDDDIGPKLRTALEAQGIDVTGVRILAGEQTGRVAVMVEENGEASALGFLGANLLFQPLEENIECLAGKSRLKPDVLIANCTLRVETVERLLEMAHTQRVDTVFSASPIVPLKTAIYAHVTHLIINEHEAAALSDRPTASFLDLEFAKQTARVFVGHGAKYVAITLGPAGAVYATYDGASGHVMARKNVNVLDTTGAGDSFLGAYVVSMVQQKRRGEWNIEEAISHGNKAAARAIEQVGAQTTLPWADEIRGD